MRRVFLFFRTANSGSAARLVSFRAPTGQPEHPTALGIRRRDIGLLRFYGRCGCFTRDTFVKSSVLFLSAVIVDTMQVTLSRAPSKLGTGGRDDNGRR